MPSFHDYGWRNSGLAIPCTLGAEPPQTEAGDAGDRVLIAAIPDIPLVVRAYLNQSHWQCCSRNCIHLEFEVPVKTFTRSM